jgi:ComF family protein
MNISWLHKTLEYLTDLLLPKEEKVKLLETLGPAGLFAKIPLTEHPQALFCYKNSLCRQAIWEIKFRGNKKLIRDFGLLLYEHILEELSDRATFSNFKNIILLPVPSSKSSQREKGFNQCVLICRELMKIDKERKQNTFTLAENFLIKKINTAHQSRSHSRQERLENLKNTFEVKNTNLILADYSFILIDDVITTGATMVESFRALQEAGAKKIMGVALAH